MSEHSTTQDHALTQEQQEIVDLLRNELAELVDADSSCLESHDFQNQQELLFEYKVHLEHIGNALELAGLGGLAYCTQRLSESFKCLLESETPAPTHLELPIRDWGSHFVGYLQYVGFPEKEQVYIKTLLDFLSQSALPNALDASDIEKAKELFNVSDLSVITDEDESLPSEVTEEMSSLHIAQDVRPELLQGMLIELPEQTRQFESSISDFLSSHEFEDLTQAQRIAHTIKGAANVVAIQGMANLTHFTEDLLETAAKNLDSPPRGFDDLLVRTSDCLAETAEFLNKQGPAPGDLREVMQELLDWLNKLKQGETPEDVSTEEVFYSEELPKATVSTLPLVESEKVVTAPEERPQQASEIAPPDLTPAIEKGKTKETVEAHKTESSDNDRFINLPEKTAQELLRLSGEVQISNNQLAAQITTLENSLGLTDRYHKQIKTMATELEALVQTQSALRAASMKYSDNEIDPLEMERFNELHTFSNRLLELTTDSYETITSIDNQIKELSALSISQRQLNNDNQDILLEMNLLPVSTISSRLMRCVRQTCRLTGKSAQLRIVGEDLLLDSRVLSRIADPIMHLLRNAIDHGLEADTEKRTKLGKPAEGNLTLSFINKGDTIEILCKDDGRGLNYDRIKASAIKRGLLDEGTPVNETLLNQLILIPGFSTRDSATQTSGRGIGLDSVISDIRKLKGSMHINSEPDQGCTISIVVPTSILTSHALLVECRDRHMLRTYGIATRGIQQIIYVDKEELVIRNRKLTFTLNEEVIPVQTISELLGIISLEEESITALLITERNDGSPLAIGVEKVSASQDLVIKPLNRFSYQVPGVIGATILGDGGVSPVIDIHELPGMSLSQDELDLLQEQRARMILAERANFVEPLAALVVDDSLSARRSLAQFVSDLGMEVYTAKDGFDAINVINEKKPSLMLVDLEMPRMNGLELTAHLRSREEYRDIPVIMITSRSTSRHKELARNAGVTTYLTKPWSDDELTSCINAEIA